MLVLLSVLYLALPYFIFAYGWLWWPYATVVWLVLLVALALTAVRAGRFQLPHPRESSRVMWLNSGCTLLVTLGLVYLSGAGGLGCQQSVADDWMKHNAMVHDLVTSAWPVAYPETASTPDGCRLTYYIAYYLPAALVGRLFGLMAAHLALFVWTSLGLLLVAAWMTRLLRTRLWVVWAAFFALSGMDALGVLLRGGGPWVVMEWWAALGQYSSNMSLLSWVPQHMLPGWIATAMIVDLAERYEDVSMAGLVAALTGIWSPLVTIGLVPVGLLLAFRCRWRTALTVQNLVAAPLILLVSVAYLASNQGNGVPFGWNFLHYDWPWFVKAYPPFCLLEFGIYAIFVALHLRSAEARQLPGFSWTRAWLWLAVVVLTFLPLCRLGLANDLVMRASIPVLLVFWVVLLRVLISPLFRWEKWYSSLLALCLLVGAIQPIYQLGLLVVGTRPGLHFCGNQPQISVPELRSCHLPQYLGRSEAFFYRYLAPPPRGTK